MSWIDEIVGLNMKAYLEFVEANKDNDGFSITDENYEEVIRRFEELMDSEPKVNSIGGYTLIYLGDIISKFEDKKFPW